MAYVYDNKTYRNLQQQVKENMDDIARLQNLKLVGLDVSHIVDTEEDLADITAEQGMVVAVGTEQPYTLFVYNDSSWVDFGEFPKAGPQGAQGPQGQVGNPGPRGLTGEPGPRGYTGAAGPAGSPGPQGARGPQGPAGPKGDRGVVDAYAADAESITAVGQAYVDEDGYLQVCTSLSPLTFEQGASVKGPKGDTGEQGPQGIQGEQGAQGPTGATGPQGARGPQGEQGIRGPQGEQGIQGPQGPTGATGPEGPQGPKGDTGAQGPTGPTGPQGPKGDPGLTASVEVNGQVYTTDSTGKITLPDYPADVAWGNITGTLSSQTDLQSALDAKADVSAIPTTMSWSQITNKPTIGNATLTIQKNGASVGTFTANAVTSKSINITVPTATSDLTNDSGFITSSAIPTNVSAFTNDAGYITSSDIPTNYVTTDTAQTITASKTISDSDEDSIRFLAPHNSAHSIEVSGDGGDWITTISNGGLAIKDHSAHYLKIGREHKIYIGTSENGTLYTLTLPNLRSGTFALTSDIPTNYVTTNTAQTISGIKTVSRINLENSSNYGGYLQSVEGASSYNSIVLSTNGTNSASIRLSDNSPSVFIKGALLPNNSSTARYNLGGPSISGLSIINAWQNLYLNGKILKSFNNNYGFQLPLTTNFTADKVLATTDQIPTAVSELTNDSGYQTASDVSTAIAGQTKETWTFTLSDNTIVTKTVVLG